MRITALDQRMQIHAYGEIGMPNLFVDQRIGHDLKGLKRSSSVPVNASCPLSTELTAVAVDKLKEFADSASVGSALTAAKIDLRSLTMKHFRSLAVSRLVKINFADHFA